MEECEQVAVLSTPYQCFADSDLYGVGLLCCAAACCTDHHLVVMQRSRCNPLFDCASADWLSQTAPGLSFGVCCCSFRAHCPMYRAVGVCHCLMGMWRGVKGVHSSHPAALVFDRSGQNLTRLDVAKHIKPLLVVAGIS